MGELAKMTQDNILKPGADTKSSQVDDGISQEMGIYRREIVKTALAREAVLGNREGGSGENARVMVEVIKGNNDQMAVLLKSILDSKNSSPAIANDPYVKKLEEEIKDLRLAATSGHKSPIAVYNEMREAINNFIQDSGLVRPGGSPGAMDGVTALQIHKMDMDMEERRRQWQREDQRWQEDMEERREERRIAQLKWEEEFRLRRLEFSDSRVSRKHNSEMLEDFSGSIMDSLNTQREVEESGGVVAARPPAIRRVFKFKCDDCGQPVTVDDPQAKDVFCPSCGAAYDLVPKNKPAAPPPVQRPVAGNGQPSPSNSQPPAANKEEDSVAASVASDDEGNGDG